MRKLTRPLWMGTIALVCGLLVVGAVASAVTTVPPAALAQEEDAEGQIMGLAHRVAQLEAAWLPLALTVDCDAGETVGDALAQAPYATAPLTITIIGVCEESVTISRDNVTLNGASPGDGLLLPPPPFPSPAPAVLTLEAARRIVLNQLTLTGGAVGLRATGSSSFSASNLHITGAGKMGVLVIGSANGVLTDSTVENSGVSGIRANGSGNILVRGGLVANSGVFGVAADGGQVALMGGAVVRDSGFHGVHAHSGGSINVYRATIEVSGGRGAYAFAGGTVSVLGPQSLIRDNAKGGLGAHGGAVLLGGAIVADNIGNGVGSNHGGSVTIQDGAIVENNTGNGLAIAGGSAALVHQGSAIRWNGNHGIMIADTSVLSVQETSQISDNGGYGVWCAPAPAVAQISGDIGTVTFADNFLGPTNCDG